MEMGRSFPRAFSSTLYRVPASQVNFAPGKIHGANLATHRAIRNGRVTRPRVAIKSSPAPSLSREWLGVAFSMLRCGYFNVGTDLPPIKLHQFQ